MTCKVCGRPEPGPLPKYSLAMIVAPKYRPIIGCSYLEEPLCWECFCWQASVGRVIV